MERAAIDRLCCSGVALLVALATGACKTDAAADDAGATLRDGATEAALSEAGVPLAGACSDVSGLAPAAPWPAAGGGASRCRRGLAEGPSASAPRRTLLPLAGAFGEPLIGSDGALLVEHRSADVRRTLSVGVVGDAGTVRWSFPSGGRSALAGGDRAYLALAEGGSLSVVALELAVGAQRWRSDLAAPKGAVVGSLLVTADGLVIVGVGSDDRSELAALDERGGQLWRFSRDDGPMSATALLADQTTVVAVGESLVAVTPGGVERWSLSLGGPFAGGPAVSRTTDRELIYIGARTSSGAELLAISAAGQLAWRQPTEDDIGAPAIAAGGEVVVAFAGDEGRARPAGVLAFSPTGGRLFRTPIAGAYRLGDPLVDLKGAVFVTTDSEELVSIAPTGALRFRVALEGALALAIDAAGALVIAASDRLERVGRPKAP